MSFLIVTGDPQAAHKFYYKYIYEDNKELDTLCKRYNFKSNTPSWKWELFSGILVGDKAKDSSKGADLENYEVKSRGEKQDFEYQYHPDSWAAKLEEDKKVTHLYIIYSDDYTGIVVRILDPSHLANYFKEWEAELPYYWLDEQGDKISHKRFRKRIPYGLPIEKGKIICVIKNTELIYSNIQGLDSDLLLKPVKKR